MDSLLSILIVVFGVLAFFYIVDAVRGSRLQRRLEADNAVAMAKADESMRFAEQESRDAKARADAHQERIVALLSEQNALLRDLVQELRSRNHGV